MKYFKNKDESEDTYFVAFTDSDNTSNFINYLNTLGGGVEDEYNYRFHSRLITFDSIPSWIKSYQGEIDGAISVYGFALPLEVITDFIALMEDQKCRKQSC